MCDHGGVLAECLGVARRAHEGQVRKASGNPYIDHPVDVARILFSEAYVDDVDVLRAALLHDTLEDTTLQKDEIAKCFGERVLRLVEEVTDDRTLSRGARKRAQIAHILTVSDDAKRIKMADKLSNMRDLIHCIPPGWSLQRVLGTFAWCRAVVHPSTVGRASPQLAVALERVYADRFLYESRLHNVIHRDDREVASLVEQYLRGFEDDAE